jgi:hypothetical protein
VGGGEWKIRRRERKNRGNDKNEMRGEKKERKWGKEKGNRERRKKEYYTLLYI